MKTHTQSFTHVFFFAFPNHFDNSTVSNTKECLRTQCDNSTFPSRVQSRVSYQHTRNKRFSSLSSWTRSWVHNFSHDQDYIQSCNFEGPKVINGKDVLKFNDSLLTMLLTSCYKQVHILLSGTILEYKRFTWVTRNTSAGR